MREFNSKKEARKLIKILSLGKARKFDLMVIDGFTQNIFNKGWVAGALTERECKGDIKKLFKEAGK